MGTLGFLSYDFFIFFLFLWLCLSFSLSLSQTSCFVFLSFLCGCEWSHIPLSLFLL